MCKAGYRIQETLLYPEDAEVRVEDVAKDIDGEIVQKRFDADGNPINVDSISIGFEGNDARFPFVHSGKDFIDLVRRLGKLLGVK
jgi:hypothetical protein